MQKAFEMQEWRWCFFLAGICPIYYVAELLVRVMVFMVESQFFTTPQAMYFTVSIRVSALMHAVKPATSWLTCSQGCAVRTKMGVGLGALVGIQIRVFVQQLSVSSDDKHRWQAAA